MRDAAPYRTERWRPCINSTATAFPCESRDILLQPERLARYDILLIPDIHGYHDHVPSAGLNRMSREELENIRRWVENGGTLVASFNTGRDTPRGQDRMVLFGALQAPAWPLGRCLTGPVRERPLRRAALAWSGGDTIAHVQEAWLPLSGQAPRGARVWSYWLSDDGRFPAFMSVPCGKGHWIVIPSFRLLHPAADGGWSGASTLRRAYDSIVHAALPSGAPVTGIWPWPHGREAAYAQTFDDGGNLSQYRRVLRFVDRFELPTVFFITAEVQGPIRRLLDQNPHIDIQGHSHSHPDFRRIDYPATRRELLLNVRDLGKQPEGFRFPYVSNSFYGMLALDDLGFVYETSIAAPHKEFVRGSVVPYNIPVFRDDYYRTLNLLEISQIYRSDWYFYQASLDTVPYTGALQARDAARFRSYLREYFLTYVKPRHGAMVFLGHPMYSGYSDVTMQPDLLELLQKENVWITGLGNLARWWNRRAAIDITVEPRGRKTLIRFRTSAVPGGLTLILKKRPKRVKLRGKYSIKEYNGQFLLVLEKLKSKKIELVY